MDRTVTPPDTVYGSEGAGPEEDSHVMSERVQSVATGIYREFERMIPTYGEEVFINDLPAFLTN